MPLVQQRYAQDCFLACLCSALGWTYDAFLSVLGEEFVARVAEHGLYGADDITTLFRAFGKELGHDYLSMLGPASLVPAVAAQYAAPTKVLKALLWGRRALVQVKSKNYPGKSHMLYWNGFTVHDPSPLLTYTWDEVDPEHVWIFNERD